MTSTGEAVEMCSLSLCAGKNVAIDVVSAEADMEGAAEEVSSMLEVALPAGQRSGVVHFEVARGALLSGPKVPPTQPLLPCVAHIPASAFLLDATDRVGPQVG
jgi:hypothetical protein